MQDNTSKISFFKKVLVSIKDFDKYELFIKEDFGQAALYLLKLIAIFSFVVTIIAVYVLSNAINKAVDTIEKNFTEINYEEGILSVNNGEKIIINDFNNILGEIVIDTSDISQEEFQNYKEKLLDKGSGLYLLKDTILTKNNNLSTIAETKYSEINSTHKIENFNKEQLLEYYNKYKISIFIITAAILYFYMFIIYSFNILIDCLAFTVLTFVTAKITRVNLLWRQCFNLASHALTLPIVLNVIYLLLNTFTGFTIKYFSIMYTAITYIYILTVILMIKSDYIRIIGEVQKIKNEQEKVREELEKLKEEEKRQKEKEEVKKKDRETEKNKSEPEIGNNPEGDSA